jgi:hypothetical protein
MRPVMGPPDAPIVRTTVTCCEGPVSGFEEATAKVLFDGERKMSVAARAGAASVS